MLGITEEPVTSYTLIEKAQVLKGQTIYITYSNTRESDIKKLMSRGCKTIVLGKDDQIKDYESKFPGIIFLKYNNATNHKYYLDDERLLECIQKGKDKKIPNILKTIHFPPKEKIFLKDLRYLLILDLLKKEFPSNEFIDNRNLLLDEIQKNTNIDKNEEGEIYIIP